MQTNNNQWIKKIVVKQISLFWEYPTLKYLKKLRKKMLILIVQITEDLNRASWVI
jgi:hypothetical protein